MLLAIIISFTISLLIICYYIKTASIVLHPLKTKCTIDEQGRMQGKCKSYLNGKLYKELHYVDGKLHGEYKAWHMNSNVDTQAMYINGKREGEFKRWYDNGQMEINSFYVDNKRQGEYKSWWSDGQIYLHTFYKDGIRHGEYMKWTDTGHIVDHCIYINNERILQYPKTPEDRVYFTLKYNIPLLPVTTLC